MATTQIDHRIDYPRFRWPDLASWSTLVAFLLALALFLVPQCNAVKFELRLALAFGLVLASGCAVGFLHAISWSSCLMRRAGAYDSMFACLEETRKSLASSKSTVIQLLRERGERRCTRIDYCYMSRDTMTIALRKKQGFSVQIGDVFLVIDERDGFIAGAFTVSKRNGQHILACAEEGAVDGLWMGEVMQSGSGQSHVPPTFLAVNIKVGETADVE